jgi:hypothetical protein
MLCVLMPSMSLAVFAADYQLGEGYNVGMWNISGYSKLELAVPNTASTQLLLDDFSLFLSARYNRYLNPFVEFELTKVPIFIEGVGAVHGGSPRLVVERAYNDIQLTDEFTVRIGKMLSPVGEWNTIHAAPLVWTTIRPLTTHYNFSEFVSGVSFLYNDPDGQLPDVQLYYQPSDEFFREPHGVKPFRYQDVGGINIAFTSDLQKRLGFSVQHAENTDYGEHQVLAGLDGRFSLGALRLESELTYTWITRQNTSPHSHQNEWGGYVQAIYALNDEWSLVSRGEIFQSRYQKKNSDHLLFGVVYRPVPALSFKTEYVETFGPQLDFSRGFYASMAVLF